MNPAPLAIADTLALELEFDGEFGAAAAARRHQALLETDPVRSAGWFWLAAENYSREWRFDLSNKMLDRAEDTAPDELAVPSSVLRAENAFASGQFAAAGFYFESVENSPFADAYLADYARRGRAASLLLSWDIDGAAAVFPEGSDEWLAIRRYKSGSNKSPRIGGFLGLIPGLGYAYSGEYGNALRSLLFNSLFIWGMVETAERDQWGAFTLITFFEVTWFYSGSIYGGIDAAHRYNRARLDNVVNEVRGDSFPAPDLNALPIIKLRFEF